MRGTTTAATTLPSKYVYYPECLAKDWIFKVQSLRQASLHYRWTERKRTDEEEQTLGNKDCLWKGAGNQEEEENTRRGMREGRKSCPEGGNCRITRAPLSARVVDAAEYLCEDMLL